MKDEAHWDARYREGDLPWDTGRHDRHLERCIAGLGERPARALELGCGTGSNALWLARQGYRVTGIDISPTAIERARARAAAAGLALDFVCGDVLRTTVQGPPFAFVFDRGCLHSFDTPAARVDCAAVVHHHIAVGGHWLSMIGSADGPPRTVGPPRLSVAEIMAAVEPLFEVRELRAAYFDTDRPDPAQAWFCLLRKRPCAAPPETPAGTDAGPDA